MGHVLNCFFGWNCGLHSRRAQIDQVRYPGHAVHFTNLDYDAYRERVEALEEAIEAIRTLLPQFVPYEVARERVEALLEQRWTGIMQLAETTPVGPAEVTPVGMASPQYARLAERTPSE